jgi:hypothetical protein
MASAENVRPGKVRKVRKAGKLLMMTITCLFYVLFILWSAVVNVSCFSRAQLRSSSYGIFVQSSDAVRAHLSSFNEFRASFCLAAYNVVKLSQLNHCIFFLDLRHNLGCFQSQIILNKVKYQ